MSPIRVGFIENHNRNPSGYDAHSMFALNDRGDILAFEGDSKGVSLIEIRKRSERLHRRFLASA